MKQPAPSANAQLDALMAEIGALSATEVKAIMSQLSPSERGQVNRSLRNPSVQGRQPRATHSLAPEGLLQLSDWLLARALRDVDSLTRDATLLHLPPRRRIVVAGLIANARVTPRVSREVRAIVAQLAGTGDSERVLDSRPYAIKNLFRKMGWTG